MASKDIKTTHDDNPTGCDDINSDYYFQVVKDDSGTLSDEGMSVPQMRAVLQDVGPPPVTDVFSMTIPNNTLNALLGTLFGNYTHWQLTNSATQPLYTDVSWLTWPMPTVFNVGSFPEQTWYLYTKDEFIVHTILNAQGTQGITIAPVDTIAPVWAADAFAITASVGDPTGSFDYTITAPVDVLAGLSGVYNIMYGDGAAGGTDYLALR